MGSRSSKSSCPIEKKPNDLENRKSSLRFSNRRKSQRNASNRNEPCDTPSIKHDVLIYNEPAEDSTVSTRENENSDKRNSALQRMLPSIPDSDKERDSDKIESIYESTSMLTNFGEPVRHSVSRCDGAPELCPQSNSHRVDDVGTEDQALNDEKEDPEGKLCRGNESVCCCGGSKPTVDSTLKASGHSAEPPPSPQEPPAPEDIYTNVDQDLTTENPDVTYMQINSSDVTCISPTNRMNASSSDSNETDCVPEVRMNNNETEDTYYQVINQIPGNDYVRTDFNLNADVLAGTKTQTTAIIGPTSGPRVHAGVVFYPVQPGTKSTLRGATVEVPITAGQDPPLGCVEVGWSNNSVEFPVLAVDQRPITKVLHCLPHGSTFTSPVVIAVNLPVIEGQIEIFYSPTDVGQTPLWTKLGAIDAPENTCFTDNRNFVTLDRDRSIARFELRHFCAFFIVENGRLVEGKKTKAWLLLKNDFGPNHCSVTVRVVLGCLEDVAQQKLVEKIQLYKSQGFQKLDDIEFNLFAGDTKSTVYVKISKIQWMPDGDITNGDIDTEKCELHHLWNNGTMDAMFWQRSQTNGVKTIEFAATVHVQQDDRQDITKKIFCKLESPLPYSKPQHVPVNDYTVIQRREKPFPSRLSLGVAVPTAVPSRTSTCSSEYKYELDLHSNSSEPEMKLALPVGYLDWRQKEIEAGHAVKL